jgi:hypothetical protein
MTENEKHIIDYYESHDIGDEGIISALEVPREDAIEYHKVELYKPKSSIGIMLRWKCERCGRYYADPKLYESEPCIPWKDQ